MDRIIVISHYLAVLTADTTLSGDCGVDIDDRLTAVLIWSLHGLS